MADARHRLSRTEVRCRRKEDGESSGDPALQRRHTVRQSRTRSGDAECRAPRRSAHGTDSIARARYARAVPEHLVSGGWKVKIRIVRWTATLAVAAAIFAAKK